MPPKIKDNKRNQDKIQKVPYEPLSKLCFSFSHMTSNNRYSFKKVDAGNKTNAYEKFIGKLAELSGIDVIEAHQLGKIRGMEKIPYKQLSESMKQICIDTGIVSKDSKVAVFRFNNQNYRMICKDDIMHPNLMHIIAFDFDFSAYDHG